MVQGTSLFFLATLCSYCSLLLSPLTVSVAVAAAATLGDAYSDVDAELGKRRLRFVRRGLDNDVDFMTSRQIREPRLRFQRRAFDPEEEDLMYSPDASSVELREVRAPRLRFQRRSFESDADDLVSLPAASFVEQRQIRDPRLRFQKRSTTSLAERERSEEDAASLKDKVHLKESAQGKEDGHKDEHPVEGASSSSQENVQSPHHRQRRAAVRMSINNDLRAITDMVFAQEARRRMRELNNLRDKLLEVGKRSAQAPAVTPEVDFDQQYSVEAVKKIKDSLENLLAA